MKQFFAVCAIFLNLFLAANADVMPYYTNSINSTGIGLYQASNSVLIYSEPNEHSTVLLDVYWDSKVFNSPEVSASNLFTVFLPQRGLAFLLVVDEEDGWVQVVFNKNGEQRGWVKKDDELKFSTWRVFYNNYGRKYGLYFMKDAPEDAKNLYSSNADDAQKIGTINFPQSIRLTAVKGNWLLLNVFDMDRLQKIGYVKWRNTCGAIYLFPALK